MKIHVTFRTSREDGRSIESITLKREGGFEPADVAKLSDALAGLGTITHVSEEELPPHETKTIVAPQPRH